jgi:hypothetical protein
MAAQPGNGAGKTWTDARAQVSAPWRFCCPKRRITGLAAGIAQVSVVHGKLPGGSGCHHQNVVMLTFEPSGRRDTVPDRPRICAGIQDDRVAGR